MKMNKVFTSSLVIMMSLGLAGCASNNAAPATKINHPTSAKVAKTNNHKASGQKTSQATTSINYVENNYHSQPTIQNSHQNPVNPQRSTIANQQVSKTSDDVVLNSFFQASGTERNSNDQYLVTQNGNNYQIEIRSNNSDDTVSNLNGLYQYNPSNNSVQKMNVVTGNYE